MKASEVKIGGTYLMKVSGEVVPVEVIAIAPGRYTCVNMRTGRVCRARCASKFRRAVKANAAGYVVE